MNSTIQIDEVKTMTKLTTFLCALALLGAGAALADGGDSYGGGKLSPYTKLIEAEKFDQAIDKLGKALEKDPQDADLLNLMAFSNRKLGRFDSAMEYYQKALAIEPDHRGANEYLGELYLQLGQLDKAEERLEILDKECFFGCREFDKLEQAIKEYRRQNPS